jgi:hypothetical protein
VQNQKRPESSRDRVGGRKGASVYPWEKRAAKKQEHGVNNAPTTVMHARNFLQRSDFRETMKLQFFKKNEKETPAPSPFLRCSELSAPRTLTHSHTSRRRQPSEAHLRMSGSGKACVHRDTAAEDALPLLQLQALHHTHKEATRLFLMTARLGFIEEQIAAVLRVGLPKLNENDNAFTAALEAVPAEVCAGLGRLAGRSCCEGPRRESKG